MAKQPVRHPEIITADEKHCLTCFYHCKIDGYICCEFILVTGKRRGCPFGRKCTRYLKGDPKTRWKLNPEYTLEPGVLPGGGQKQQRKRYRVALDLDALATLKQGHTWPELAKATGSSLAVWQNLAYNGCIRPELAEKVLEIYGIDLIRR